MMKYLFSLFLIFIRCYGDLPSETVFLTWQKDPDTTMTIQWISTTQDKNELEYRVLGSSTWNVTIGSKLILAKNPTYFLNRFELLNLKPNTDYQFKLSQQEKIYSFKTMPKNLDEPIRFLVGGDMYHEDDKTKGMREMCMQAAKAKPHFVLLGGDIAYAVATTRSSEKIDRWIDWVRAWSHCMVTSEGRLIPVIAAIGNHDLIGQYNQKPEQATVFFTLFPMPGKQIYNVLDFSNYLSIFILDSGHANPIGGAQTNWLRNVLKQKEDFPYRFAIYHVPAFPSIRSFGNEQSVQIRKHWLPLFEKNGIQVAFEHHDHAYKRTFPQNGVVYIGDGAWSVDKPRTPSFFSGKREYLAKFVSARHFILVSLSKETCQIRAINDKGFIIDEYTVRVPVPACVPVPVPEMRR